MKKKGGERERVERQLSEKGEKSEKGQVLMQCGLSEKVKGV